MASLRIVTVLSALFAFAIACHLVDAVRVDPRPPADHDDSESGVTFAVIGDWGNGPDGDYDAAWYKTPNDLPYFRRGQLAVATALGVKCQQLSCKFVLNGGDSFYNLGIDAKKGIYDPQWNTSFKYVYNASSLQVSYCS